MASGALVHVNSSFRAVYGYDQRIEAFGSKGMLISRNHQPTALERYDAAGIRQDPLLRFFIERYAESYARELDDFVRAIEAQATAVDRARRRPARAADGGSRGGLGEVRRADRAFPLRRSPYRPSGGATGYAASAAAWRADMARRPTSVRMSSTATSISTIRTDAYAVA